MGKQEILQQCSENSRSQIVFRTDIFRKLTLGAPAYAAEQGVSDTKIRHSGRWKTDAFKKYIRITPPQSVS